MPESPEIFEQAMQNLPECFSPQLLFLDADRNTLIRRYSDTRRLHPLSSKNLSLESAIDEESDLLEPLRSRADLIVDTSEMSVHELAEMLRTRLLGKRERELTMVFESFGFKHGIPIDADYVFDVRFLPNPHWDPKLRPMTGSINQWPPSSIGTLKCTTLFIRPEAILSYGYRCWRPTIAAI